MLGLSLHAPAPAAEGGSTEYVGGYTGFAAGYVPPDPGSYLTSELYYYDGGVSKLAANGRLALQIGTDIYFETVQLTELTSWRLLGGAYGFGVALPFGYCGVHGQVEPPGIERSASAWGLGDAALVPAFLGWHSGDWYANVALSVFAPTGQYDENQPVNLSKNFWAVDTAFSGSYLSQHGLDLSFSLGYTVNFENPDTHYRSGDVTHLDLALGQYLTREFKVGVVGYAVVQVSGDSGSGAILGPFKSDVYAAGTALEFDPTLAGREISLQLRWYREFGARNHLEGNAVYLTTDLKL
ncbi:MAG TPA: transporter [Steroidobacteraceae bacterium]|nr:transporter [Steroidobacteraceae bacterium]